MIEKQDRFGPPMIICNDRIYENHILGKQGIADSVCFVDENVRRLCSYSYQIEDPDAKNVGCGETENAENEQS